MIAKHGPKLMLDIANAKLTPPIARTDTQKELLEPVTLMTQKHRTRSSL